MAIVIGIVCRLFVDKLLTSKVISPLHLPEKTKLIALGSDKLATPVSFIPALAENLSVNWSSKVVIETKPELQARGFETTNL